MYKRFSRCYNKRKKGVSFSMDKYVKLYKQFWIDWKNYEGKSNLNDFWTTVLCHFIVQFVIGLIIGLFNVQALTGIISLVLFVPMLALGARRLNDVGEKPTYLLWLLLPLVGWILVVLKWVKPSKVA